MAGGSATKAVPIIGPIIDGLRGQSPILMDEVSVRVEGQPGASKQELYFLALAAANGVVRRFQPLLGNLAADIALNPIAGILTAGIATGAFAGLALAIPPTAAAIRIEYDAADHWVVATISYRVSTIMANVQSGTGVFSGDLTGALGKANPATFINNLAVYRGPQCEVVGGKFDFVQEWSDYVPLPGVPGTLGQTAPDLPFANQVILTSCPLTKEPKKGPIKQAPPRSPAINSTNEISSPNPKPPGDNRSRGAVVTATTQTPTTSTSLTSGGQGGGVTTGTITGVAGGIAAGVAGGGQSPPGQSGSTATAPPSSSGYVGECCPKTMRLVQLVFAALTDPGSAADETWVPPEQGPNGG